MVDHYQVRVYSYSYDILSISSPVPSTTVIHILLLLSCYLLSYPTLTIADALPIRCMVTHSTCTNGWNQDSVKDVYIV